MKKVFESKNKEEIYKIKKQLSKKFYESEIKETSKKYELYVDANIYDEVLLQLEFEKEEKKRKTNNYKKGTFLYIVEQYFQVKYYKLVLLSLVYSIILDTVLFFQFLQTIKNDGINAEIFETLILTFVLDFIISQIIIISTRFYQFMLEIQDLFSIKILGKIDYSKIGYKIIHFFLGIILHIVYMVFIIRKFS